MPLAMLKNKMSKRMNEQMLHFRASFNRFNTHNYVVVVLLSCQTQDKNTALFIPHLLNILILVAWLHLDLQQTYLNGRTR